MKLIKQGRRWGGSKAGRLLGISPEQARQVIKLKGDGMKISAIARSVGINRSSVYRLINHAEKGLLKL